MMKLTQEKYLGNTIEKY